jgi:hypothetical protein
MTSVSYRLMSACLQELSEWKYPVALIVLVVCGLNYNPYRYGVSDHTYKIPFLKATYSPGLYSKDITVGMRRYYTTFFPELLWPLAKPLGIAVAFFLVYLISQIVFYTSIYLISVRLFRSELVGLIAVTLLLYPRQLLGGIDTFDVIVEERAIAASLLLLAFYLLMAGRPVLAGCSSAVGASVHFITFANFAIFLLVALPLCYLTGNKGVCSGRSLLRFLVVLALGIAPIVVRSTLFAPERHAAGTIDPEWLKMILARSPNHFAPDFELLRQFSLEAILTLCALLVLGMHENEVARPGFVLYLASALTMLLGFLLGYLFVTACPIPLGIQLSFFRSSFMFVVLSQLAVAWICHVLLRSTFAGAVAIFFLAPRLTAIAVLCGCAVILHVLRPATRRMRWGWTRGQECSQVHEALAVLTFLGCVVTALVVRYGDGPDLDDPFTQPRNDRVDVQLWLRQNTDVDALVMTPPDTEDFRIFSERSILGTWKDWTFNCLDREFAVSMSERLRDTGNLSPTRPENTGPTTLNDYYHRLTDADLIALAQKYKVDVIVTNKRSDLRLEKVYGNNTYDVYKPSYE